MKVKRYFAVDMRQALNLARQEHGPDVVILGNRKVLGGVELIAAQDYDESFFVEDGLIDEIRNAAGTPALGVPEQASRPPATDQEPLPGKKPVSGNFWSQETSLEQVQQELNSLRRLLEQQMSGLAWGEVGRRHPLWAGLLRKLGDLGISPAIARNIVEQIPEHYSLEQAWRTTLALLSYRIPVCHDNILAPGSVVAFAGASGTGKTTTIAKLAARYVLEHDAADVILATLDSYRVGGREQLSSYAKILGVPMRVIHNRDDLNEMMDQFHGRKLILIDTAGLGPQDQRRRNQIEILRQADSAIRLCLVLSATSQVVTLRQVMDTYRVLRPSLCALTKLDEASSLGAVLSVVIDEGLQIGWHSSGQQVPDDLARTEATDLIARSIGLLKKYSTAPEEEQIEQNFGKYAVYNPLGRQHEHQ